jgi:hypothetical protein
LDIRQTRFRAVLPALRLAAFLATLATFDHQAVLSQNPPDSGAGSPICNLSDQPRAEEHGGGMLQNRDIVAAWHLQDHHLSNMTVADKTPFSGFIRD